MCVCIIKLFYACNSPLHIAAKSGLVGVVKELINRGADLNIRDADGMSSLIASDRAVKRVYGIFKVFMQCLCMTLISRDGPDTSILYAIH